MTGVILHNHVSYLFEDIDPFDHLPEDISEEDLLPALALECQPFLVSELLRLFQLLL